MTEKDQNISARERILSVAEKIFLEEGFDRVSVRDLTTAAGVNLALVNYYFGGKRNLYLEVLRRKFSSYAEMKCLSLRREFSEMVPPDLRGIIAIYVMSYLDSDQSLLATQNFHALITRQLAEDKDAVRLLLQELVTPVQQLLKDEIKQVCPDLSESKISFCISSITGQIFHYIRCPESFGILAETSESASHREEIAQHIIEFSLKGIQKETICDYIP